ncbi:MAG: class I SAM-dependent methyltransferase [Cryomorphaceae bacterium]|nr:class I SAM-dependent methyltransferase [Cryomorphaceae bacterium]
MRVEKHPYPLANPVTKDCCGVCQSQDIEPFIQTKAMMHPRDEGLYEFHRCRNCASVFLANPEDENQLSRFYSSAYLPYRGSSAWGKFSKFVENDDKKLNQRRSNLAASALDNKDKPSILDIGCGKPDFLKTFTETHNAKAVGVDFVAANWDQPQFERLELHECDWKTFTFDSTFDVITAWHYLEHDYDISSTVSKIYDLLKPGGYFIAEVPMHEGLLQHYQKQHWQGWHTPRHLTLFSKKSWSSVFPDTHWDIVEHQTYGTMSAFTLWWLGHREKKATDWEGDMSKYFWGLVFWKVLLMPFFLLEKVIPMGVQTVIIRKK